MDSSGLAGLERFDFMNKGMYPGSQIDKTQYTTSSQLPTAAQTVDADYDPKTNPLTGEPMSRFASGGLATLRYNGEEDGSQVEAPTEPAPPPTMAELAAQLNEAYRTNSNYDDIWKQFAATKEQNPEEWYKHQLEFLGGQQGWQIGQNTSERNDALQPQINDTIAQAKSAGLSDDQINNILGSSNQAANAENQRRIAQLKEIGGTGFSFQKDLQPGLVMLALATAAAMTGGAAAPAIEGAEVGGGALAAGEGAGDVFAGYSAAGSSAGTAGSTVPAGYGALGSSAASTGAAMGPTYGELGITGLSEGAMGPTYGEMGYTGLNQAEAIASADAAAKSGYGLKDAYNAYKYANQAKNVLGALSGDSSGSMASGAYGNANLNSPYALPSGFNAGTNASDLAILNALKDKESPWSSLMPPIMLSKTSDFAPEFSKDMAAGGITTLGSYSDGGRLLKGPGDGMSDNIPAKIGNAQPARLADGEFVVPADVVSHLGNGSTDAGAKQLYSMMDKIRKARTGTKKQGKQINPSKFLP